MVATLLWGRFAFGVDLTIEHPLLFALSVPATVISIGMLGFLLAVAFVRYRTAWALGNMFEYPVWLVCGFLVPLSLFPDWVRPISWVLAPTWGVNAIRESALGGTPLADMLMCFGLGALYTAIGVLLARAGAEGGAGARDPVAHVTSLRVFFVGGLTSYRALFSFLSPWIFIPSLLVAPIFQILLFAYIGRAAGVESDEFYVIGNALQYASIPCLFAMTQTIAGERYQQTLGFILVSPARRLPLFLGRALPVIVNGFVVSVFALVVGGALLDVDIAAGAWPSIAFVTALCAFSCTGLGLINAGSA